MSEYKHFVVAGAGNLGSFIIEELVKLKKQGTIASVIAFTRSNDSHEEIVRLGAKPVNVNYLKQESLVTALKGVDVVISTLPIAGISFEKNLATACKALEMKLFVPSEFGLPTVDHYPGQKAKQRRYLDEIKLPYAVFFTGPFTDMILKPFIGFDFEHGKINIGGSGDKPVSWTARRDIARYVAHVLTTLPSHDLENAIFPMEGERISFNDLFAAWEARTGKTLEVTRKSRAELEEALKKDPSDFLALLFLKIDIGEGVVGKPEDTNLHFPDWNPQKVLEVLLD